MQFPKRFGNEAIAILSLNQKTQKTQFLRIDKRRFICYRYIDCNYDCRIFQRRPLANSTAFVLYPYPYRIFTQYAYLYGVLSRILRQRQLL